VSHLAALASALENERRAVTAEYAQLRALPMADRVAAGFSVAPVEVVDVEHRSRDRVNVLVRAKGSTDAFNPGDPVVLAPLGRPDEGLAGRVEGRDESTLELRVPAAPEGKGPWAVSRRLDFTVLDLQKAALDRAERTSSPLRSLLLGMERPYRPDPYPHPAFSALDPSQREAAELALGATEIGLVHGPPGTGKTEVLVAILRALVERGERPWALAESNAAVDHLTLRAAAAGLDVVRMGVSARVGGAVRPLTLEHRILHGPRATVIEALRRQASRATGDELGEVRAAIREEWSAAKREILDNAHVLTMTLGTLHTRGADLAAPRTAVVDEGGQISEPALWLLATRVKRLILAGDPQQLGPVVKSQDPRLTLSLLERLVNAGFVFPMLTVQRRMSSALMALSSSTYAGRIQAHPDVAEQNLAELGVEDGPWTAPPARFIDTAGLGYDEERDALGSWHNPGELGLVVRVVESLVEAGVPAEDIGVITPYSAQLARIRGALPNVESGTVNAFQGREKEVIVASFVRSNPDGDIGFVADPRRLNVSVTRARRLFVGIGDSATLGASPSYSRLVEAVGDGYISAWELV
jgi:superfamily I DNA and/or RNA helicase